MKQVQQLSNVNPTDYNMERYFTSSLVRAEVVRLQNSLSLVGNLHVIQDEVLLVDRVVCCSQFNFRHFSEHGRPSVSNSS